MVYKSDWSFIKPLLKKEEPLSAVEEKARELYGGRLKRFGGRPSFDRFAGFYSEDKIADDKKALAAAKERFNSSDQHERAHLLSDIILVEGERSSWFGDNAYVTEASEYDDVINHADLVVEFESDDGALYPLAVDVTTADDKQVLVKKGREIEGNVSKGTLTVLQYVLSGKTGEPTRFDNVPRVVVRVSKSDLSGIAAELLKSAPAEIAKHPLQYHVLLEIKEQLDDMAELVRAEKTFVPENKKRAILEGIEPVAAFLFRRSLLLRRSSFMTARREVTSLFSFTFPPPCQFLFKSFRLNGS